MPKKPPFLRFTISDPIFEFHVLIQLGGNRGDLLYQYECLNGETPQDFVHSEPSSSCQGTTFAKDFRANSAIWLRNIPDSPNDTASLAHEAVHAAKHMLKVNRALNEETLAYTAGWIVKMVLKQVQCCNDRRKRRKPTHSRNRS